MTGYTVFFAQHQFLFHVLLIVAIALLAWILLWLTHRAFRRARERQEGLHLHFFERVISTTIIVAGVILVFSVFGGIDSVWKTLLGGTAIISAVLAFAAQDAIKDILAGLMISVYRPFEIGNRIVLEDGTAGIVKDITMRHVVIVLLESQVLVIPNSQINVMRIRNFSYQVETRSAHFRFQIAYGTDVELAQRVIKQAVCDSPYSIPGWETAQGMEYGEVYFMAFEESSLRLDTMVYYEAGVRSEVLISDINLRVNRALEENGIEIPYNYINVVQK